MASDHTRPFHDLSNAPKSPAEIDPYPAMEPYPVTAGRLGELLSAWRDDDHFGGEAAGLATPSIVIYHGTPPADTATIRVGRLRALLTHVDADKPLLIDSSRGLEIRSRDPLPGGGVLVLTRLAPPDRPPESTAAPGSAAPTWRDRPPLL